MIARLVGAIQFLTIVPVPGRGASPPQSAAFFPIVGAMLGVAGWLGYSILLAWLPASIAALLTIKLWSWLSGSFHEDGLADAADAFRAGRSPQKIHTILKDSRLGTYGTLALIFSIGLRWQALVYFAVPPLTGFVVAQTLSRAASVAMAWIARPAAPGSGSWFSAELSTSSALVAIGLGVISTVPLGVRASIVILSATTLLVLGARRYFYRRIGGITGDCLGAVAQLVEILTLLLLSCRNCSW